MCVCCYNCRLEWVSTAVPAPLLDVADYEDSLGKDRFLEVSVLFKLLTLSVMRKLMKGS